MHFLQEHPRLATGAPTAPSARDRTRKLWEKQALHLNSLGGSVKSWTQWRKYWADKKSAVKKKAAQRFAERVKNCDEIDEMIQLTDTEERILGVMGGDSFEAEELHAAYNGLQQTEQVQQCVPSSPPADVPLTCSVDIHVKEEEEEQPEPPEQPEQPEQPDTSTFEIENMEGHAASVLSISLIEQPDVPPPLAALTQTFSNWKPPVSPETLPALPTPRLLHNINPRHTRRKAQTVTTSPPSQRRSQLVSLAERFLRVEENRLHMDRRYATIIENLLERDKERDRTVAQALNSLGDSLKLIADAIKK